MGEIYKSVFEQAAISGCSPGPGMSFDQDEDKFCKFPIKIQGHLFTKDFLSEQNSLMFTKVFHYDADMNFLRSLRI